MASSNVIARPLAHAAANAASSNPAHAEAALVMFGLSCRRTMTTEGFV